MSAPLPANERERLQALRRHAILDTPPEPAFDRITRLATRLLKVPIALVSIVDENRQWFKASRGLDVKETSREQSFCAHAILTHRMTIVPDASRDDRFAENTLVTGSPHIRFYAGAPLQSSDGFNLGTLCAIDIRPRTLSSEEQEILRDLAEIAVTELRLREALLQGNQRAAALAHLSFGVLVTDPQQGDNPIIYCNPGFSAITGYTPEEVIGRNCRFLQGLESDPVVVREIRDAISARRVFRGLLVNYRKSGEPFWNELTICPVLDPDGRLVNLVGLQNDVTERKRGEEALQKSFEQLEKLEALKDNLTSMIVHDLRSPVAVTMGYLNLLKGSAEDARDAEALEYIDKAQQGTETLHAMITSLLDVKRLEAGEMPLVHVPCDLGALTGAVLASLAVLTSEHRLTFELPTEPVLARCDVDIIRRVITNLVQNALKFTPRHGEVRVAAAKRGSQAFLSVMDTGPGIARDYHEKIFEKFGQVASHRTVHSTGLGLAFCRLAIEGHGGTIGVQSEVGAGSTFWFSLPTA